MSKKKRMLSRAERVQICGAPTQNRGRCKRVGKCPYHPLQSHSCSVWENLFSKTRSGAELSSTDFEGALWGLLQGGMGLSDVKFQCGSESEEQYLLGRIFQEKPSPVLKSTYYSSSVVYSSEHGFLVRCEPRKFRVYHQAARGKPRILRTNLPEIDVEDLTDLLEKLKFKLTPRPEVETEVVVEHRGALLRAFWQTGDDECVVVYKGPRESKYYFLTDGEGRASSTVARPRGATFPVMYKTLLRNPGSSAPEQQLFRFTPPDRKWRLGTSLWYNATYDAWWDQQTSTTLYEFLKTPSSVQKALVGEYAEPYSEAARGNGYAAYLVAVKLLVYVNLEARTLGTYSLQEDSSVTKCEFAVFQEKVHEVPLWSALREVAAEARARHHFTLGNAMVVRCANGALLYREGLGDLTLHHVAGNPPPEEEYLETSKGRYWQKGWDGQRYLFQLGGELYEWSKGGGLKKGGKAVEPAEFWREHYAQRYSAMDNTLRETANLWGVAARSTVEFQDHIKLKKALVQVASSGEKASQNLEVYARGSLLKIGNYVWFEQLAPFEVTADEWAVLLPNHEFVEDHRKMFAGVVELERTRHGVANFFGGVDYTEESFTEKWKALRQDLRRLWTRVQVVPEKLNLAEWLDVRSSLVCGYTWNETFWQKCGQQTSNLALQLELSRLEAPEQTKSTTCKSVAEPCRGEYSSYLVRVQQALEAEGSRFLVAHARYKLLKRAFTAQLQAAALYSIYEKQPQKRAEYSAQVQVQAEQVLRQQPEVAGATVAQLENVVKANAQRAMEFVVGSVRSREVESVGKAVRSPPYIETWVGGGDLNFTVRYDGSSFSLLEERPWVYDKLQFVWKLEANGYEPQPR